MSMYFLSPAAPLVPTTARSNHPGNQLFRHYRPWDAGLNVWLLKDGTVTTSDPADDSLVKRVFHGGHIHRVDAGEAAVLGAAGFALVVLEDVASSAPLPGFIDGSSEPGPTGLAFGTYGAGTYGEGHYGGSA